MQSTVEHQVHQEKEQSENEDCHNHHGRGSLHFLSRRRNNLPHLRAYIGQKARRIRPHAHRTARHVRQRARLFALLNRCFARHTSNPSEQFVVHSSQRVPLLVVAFACTRCSLFPTPCSLSCPISGRGGGIRTPKFGFGDRQFNR